MLAGESLRHTTDVCGAAVVCVYHVTATCSRCNSHSHCGVSFAAGRWWCSFVFYVE